MSSQNYGVICEKQVDFKSVCLMGVKVVSVADGELKDFNDKLSVGIKRVINEFEAQKLRQRTKAGIAAKTQICQGLDVWKPARRQGKEKRRDY